MTTIETLETVKTVAELLPGVVTNIVGCASVLAAYLPKQDKPWRKYLDFAAFNIKNAENK